MWGAHGGQNITCRSQFPFHHVSSEDHTQVVRLGGKSLYLPHHLARLKSLHSHAMRKEGSGKQTPAQAAAPDSPDTSAKHKGKAAWVLAALLFHEKHLLRWQPGKRDPE